MKKIYQHNKEEKRVGKQKGGGGEKNTEKRNVSRPENGSDVIYAVCCIGAVAVVLSVSTFATHITSPV